MWYAWIEAQRRWVRAAGVWAWPALPGSDWLTQLIQPLPAVPGFDIPAVRIGAHTVPVTEHVVDGTPFCALRAFTRDAAALPDAHRDARTAILICAPLAGHHAVMLREMVETCLQDGDVYLTDWADARDVPLAAGTFGLDDYVRTVERFLTTLAGERIIHAVAVCQATTPTLAALARLARGGQPPARTLTLMGGPIDSRLNPTSLAHFAQAHDIEWFRRTWIDTVPPPYAGAGRRVYPGLYQQASIIAAYPQHKWELEVGYWTSRARDDAEGVARGLRKLGEYAAVLDMDERYFLDTIRVVFQEQRLARHTWRIDGELVRPQALSSIALCTVEGARDNVTGAEQTHAAQRLCSTIPAEARLQLTIPDCDHYGLFSGAPWRERIHPALARFWRAQAAAPRAPREPGAPRARARTRARRTEPATRPVDPTV
jgi:poly(3-hydroxybutyrate) depolymerase